MRAVVIASPGEVEVTTVDDPTPGPHDVVVEVAACGICGTDLHILDGGLAPSLPVVPGHEFAGTVVAVGGSVGETGGPSIGDRVAVDPNLHCGACGQCRRGRGNLCERYAALGVTTAGGAADYAVAPAGNCVVLPDHVDVTDAALIEPLSCAVRGYDVLRTRLGDHVLVYGAGTMGLLNLALAQRAGAVSVDVVDLDEERLRAARLLGAQAAERDADLLARDEWEVVIDCTGVVAAIEDGLGRVARGGTFLQFGVADEEALARWSPFAVYKREITITGSMAVLHSFERAAELFAAGVVDAATIVTHRHPLADYGTAIERFRAGEGLKHLVGPAPTA